MFLVLEPIETYMRYTDAMQYIYLAIYHFFKSSFTAVCIDNTRRKCIYTI